MSLSPSQLNNLTSLFTPQAVQDPLSKTLQEFNHFFSKLDQYKVGTAVTLLLQHDPVISVKSEYRLLAIIFILELYNDKKAASDSNITNHPFLALIRRLITRVNSFRLEETVVEQHKAMQLQAQGLAHEGASSNPCLNYSNRVKNPDMLDVARKLAAARQPPDGPATYGARPGASQSLACGAAQFDKFKNSVLPVLTPSEQKILKLLVHEKLVEHTDYKKRSLAEKSIRMLLSKAYTESIDLLYKQIENVEQEIFQDLDMALITSNSRLPESVTSTIDAISIDERNIFTKNYEMLLVEEEIKAELARNQVEKRSTSVVDLKLYQTLVHSHEVPLEGPGPAAWERNSKEEVTFAGSLTSSLNGPQVTIGGDLGLAANGPAAAQSNLNSNSASSKTDPAGAGASANTTSQSHLPEPTSRRRNKPQPEGNGLTSQATARIFRPTIRYPPPPINFLIEDELAWTDIDEISLDVQGFEYDYNVEDNWAEFLKGNDLDLNSKLEANFFPSADMCNVMPQDLEHVDILGGFHQMAQQHQENRHDQQQREKEVNNINGRQLNQNNIKDRERDSRLQPDPPNVSQKQQQQLAQEISIQPSQATNNSNNNNITNPKTAATNYSNCPMPNSPDLRTAASPSPNPSNSSQNKNSNKSNKKKNQVSRNVSITSSNFSEGQNGFDEIKELLILARTEELSSEQEDKITTDIKNLNDSKTNLDVTSVGFIPENLPQFIDKNARTTVELLCHIAQTNERNLKPYLEIFVDKNYKIEYRKSLEVIVHLCNVFVIPKDFLHLYISHSVEVCDNTPDKLKRDRYGRIFCVFVKSLMSNNQLKRDDDHQEVFIIIENFVVHNTHIKEATALFKILRSGRIEEKVL